MKNVYMGLGGVVIAVLCFGAGIYFDRYSASVSSLQGTIVARDLSSITLKLSDGSVRQVKVGDATVVFAQTEPAPAPLDALTPGRKVQVTLQGDMAGIVFMTVQPSTSAK